MHEEILFVCVCLRAFTGSQHSALSGVVFQETGCLFVWVLFCWWTLAALVPGVCVCRFVCYRVCACVCVRIPCRCACLCVSGLFQKFWQKWTCLDQACAVVYNGSIYTHIDLMLKVDHLPVFSCSAHACRHTSTTHMQTVVSSTCRYTQEKEDKAHHPLADSSQAIELNTHLRGWSHVVTVQRKACPGFLLP